MVWGDTDRCPYSVGESGSRTTIMTGYAVVEAARDLKKQIAEKGLPKGGDVLIASASPNPTVQGKVRSTFGAHFVEVEVDTELGRVRVTKYRRGPRLRPHHESAHRDAARSRAARSMGIGMALHEDLIYDRRSGSPLTAGYYGARVATHRDAPEIEVDLHRDRRRLRAVRREEHGRIEQDAGAGGGRQRDRSTRSACG